MKLPPIRSTLGPLLAIALVLVIPMAVTGSYGMGLVIMTLFYGYIAMAWNIVGGMAGQLSLGHSAFLGIGAYAFGIAVLQFHVPPIAALLLGGLAGALLSALIAYPSTRLQGAYYSLVTLAFGELVLTLVQNTKEFWGLQIRAASGLYLPFMRGAFSLQFTNKIGYYYFILTLLGLIGISTWWISRSKLGYYLAAVRNDRDGARALGIDVPQTQLIAATISGFFMGIGGVFYAQYILFLEPARVFGFQLSLDALVLATIGGKGTIVGPLLGAVLLRPVADLVNATWGGTFAGVHYVVYGVVLMGAVTYFPQGILGFVRRWTQRAAVPAERG